MKKILYIAVLMALVSGLKAQQQITFTQSNENRYMLNPAAAGYDESMPVFLGYKRMWTGMDDAPSYQFLSYQMKLSDNLGGVGGQIYNYTTGPINKAGLKLSYAYHLELGDEMFLSFGLSGSLYQYHLDKSKLKFENNEDNLYILGSEKLIVPDADFGIYFYGKNYYAGLSSFQLFGRRVDLMNDELSNPQVRHYHLHGGYRFEINDDFKLEPSALVKYVESSFSQWDINVKTTYKDLVYLGVGYRSDFAFAPQDVLVSLGVQQAKFKLGYAFDIAMSDIGSVSRGTHEIYLMYFLGKTDKSAYKW